MTRSVRRTTPEPDHDVFTCECHETCSWCCEPVLDSSLREQPDGARICRACVQDPTRVDDRNRP